MLWKNNWQVRILLNHRQYVHMEIRISCQFVFKFTVVYGSPQSKFRTELWNRLYGISSTIRGPWIVAGDFNAMLNKDEKIGGAKNKLTGFKKFYSWMRDCSMIDMGFLGSQFTWKRGTIQERLDRFVCNRDWKSNVQKDQVLHLPRIRSDHCPLMLNFMESGRCHTKKILFHLAAWETHPDWTSFMDRQWDKRKFFFCSSVFV